ncbi:unnamed protein product [Discula destructiva]
MKSSLPESATTGAASAAAPDSRVSSSSSSDHPITPTRSSSSADHDDNNANLAGAGQLNERSPLLSPVESDQEQHGFLSGASNAAPPETDSFQATKSIWYLILLTISIGGLQIAWSVELSNGTPFLVSLGLSKSLMALVWIAGPLTGTLVQPYVGMLSDQCRLSWGKRKPFMLGGAVATMISLMILAWSRNIVGGFLSLFGADPASHGVKVTIIVFAVIWIYILDFAINTVQAAIRAFIVDCCPAHQQEAANAMASRITGVGNIVGYVAGYVHLPKIMPWLGDTQFKCLCAIASVALGSTVLMSMGIKERNPQLDGPKSTSSRKLGAFSFFVQLFASIKRLPPQTKKVCIVQFCAWIGFFPMLFYTSSYIGEIYVQPFLEQNPNMTDPELDDLYEEATRVGTFALLIFAITSLATNVFLPFLIAPTYDRAPIGEAPGEGPTMPVRTYDEKKTWADHLVIPGLTLRRAWLLSQLLFMISMLCTVLVRTVPAATVLIGLVGITWALTLWAPFAIISAEISRRDALLRQKKRAVTTAALAGPSAPSTSTAAAAAAAAAASASGAPRFDGYSSDNDHKLDDAEEESDQAGVILGIHNMAIAAPQILATMGSSLIFKFFQKPRSEAGDHSYAIVMAIGGITVGASAWFIHLIRDEPEVGVVDDVESDGANGEEREALSPLARRFDGAADETPRSSTEGAALMRRPMNRSRVSLDRANLMRSKSYSGMDYA